MDEIKQLVEYSRLAWDRKLTEGTGGNMSFRKGDRVYITPTTKVKHFLGGDDIVILSTSGDIIYGEHSPSSEYRMHLKLYETCPDIKAVFHAHPRYATAYAIMHKKLPENLLPEVAYFLAPLTYLPYRMPGTDEFAEVFVEGAKAGSRAFVLENHGVTTAADSIEQAYAKLETLEFLAQLSHISGAEPGKLEIAPQEIERFLAHVKS
jgi:L-fuculose-phosphate aldolase